MFKAKKIQPISRIYIYSYIQIRWEIEGTSFFTFPSYLIFVRIIPLKIISDVCIWFHNHVSNNDLDINYSLLA